MYILAVKGIPSFSLVKDKTLRENWLHLEGNIGRQENVIAHIGRVAKRHRTPTPKMGIWLGTYEHKDKTGGEDCFIVWAASKQEAIEYVAARAVKPFEKHVRPLVKAGFIGIRVSFKSGQMSLVPPKDDLESGLWIYTEDFE